MEVPIGFEPMITELQSIALPLGYGTIKKWWGRRDLNPHGINSQRILSPLRLPISPRPLVLVYYITNLKNCNLFLKEYRKKHETFVSCHLIKMEVPIGFEPMITELQSIALPLGYGTIKKWWGRRDLNPHGINSQRILSPLRLPISPRPLVLVYYITYLKKCNPFFKKIIFLIFRCLEI